MFDFIIPFIALILVVVFIHEYGHFYFARKYGVGVTDFSIGFGKEIFGWNDKTGTRWKICWIPLGGYVKFFGDRNVYSQQDHEEILEKYNKDEQQKLFVTKPLYQRSLIVFGGPLANFLLAIVIFLSIYMFVGKDFTPAVIDEVQKDSPAQVAGLMKNDIILEIDNNKVESILDVSKYIAMSTSEYVDFKISRYGEDIIFKIKPNLVLSEDNLGNKVNKRMVGIKLSPYKNEINHKKLEVTEKNITNYLYTKKVPDPDILIRTGKTKRLSNFLLWQIAYTEFVFLDIFWPDFGRNEFIEAIYDFQNRERRFGMVSEQINTVE